VTPSVTTPGDTNLSEATGLIRIIIGALLSRLQTFLLLWFSSLLQNICPLDMILVADKFYMWFPVVKDCYE